MNQRRGLVFRVPLDERLPWVVSVDKLQAEHVAYTAASLTSEFANSRYIDVHRFLMCQVVPK